MNDDTISRRAAIDRINKQREHLQPDIYPQDKIGDAAYRICAEFIERLPSAQPEKRTEERTETHACDCIERQAAIDAILAVTGYSSVRELYEHVQEHGLSDMWSGGVNAAIDIIIAVPSAQTERKKGEWQITEAYPHNVYCSECHTRFAQTQWTVWEDGSLPRNFCPNCGADMRGDSNE